MTTVDSGSFVLVVGVGGLGHLGIQLLRELTNARILAADDRPDRLDLALRLGAEGGYPTTSADFVPEIRRASGGEGVDVVLDLVAEHGTPDRALRVLRRGGTCSILGTGEFSASRRWP